MPYFSVRKQREHLEKIKYLAQVDKKDPASLETPHSALRKNVDLPGLHQEKETKEDDADEELIVFEGTGKLSAILLQGLFRPSTHEATKTAQPEDRQEGAKKESIPRFVR